MKSESWAPAGTMEEGWSFPGCEAKHALLTGGTILLPGQSFSDLFCTEVAGFKVAVLHSQTLPGCLAGREIRWYFQAGYF